MFAAVMLPDRVRDHLEVLVEPRRDQAWRWSPPEHWHITLAFYAAVEPWRLDELTPKLAHAAERSEPFRLALNGVGCFPDVSRAKVLYAAVDDPTATLPALAERARNAATTTGIEVTRERYVAHVTLARANRAIEASRWMRALTELFTPSWQVDEIALVQSHLGQGPRGRPRYEVRERFPLGKPALRARAGRGD